MKISDRGRLAFLLHLACVFAILPGCGARGPDTEYGLSRGTSLNGTSAFAAMFRQRGHEVRPAIRLTEELAEWAQGIVRFAPYPGPPEASEAQWLRQWLAEDPDRWLIYVVRDFDAREEYWKAVRDEIAESDKSGRRAEAEENRMEAADWFRDPPAKPGKTGSPVEWFTVENAVAPPKVCTKLEGLWAQDLDALAAQLSLHQAIQSDRRSVLLSGDGKALVLDKSVIAQGNMLILANGSFLLNEPLVNAARRPLALRVAEWPERAFQRVAFVEGSFVMSEGAEAMTLLSLAWKLPAFAWVLVQMICAGVFAALARAPRLGRPRPDPASGADRPAAHAEALGALLARGRASTEAVELLERYRHWRWPHGLHQSAGESGN